MKVGVIYPNSLSSGTHDVSLLLLKLEGLFLCGSWMWPINIFSSVFVFVAIANDFTSLTFSAIIQDVNLLKSYLNYVPWYEILISL